MKDLLSKVSFGNMVSGAVAILILGFGFMSWTLGGTAERMAADQAKSAVTLALTPYCVLAAKADAENVARMAEFEAASASNRAGLVEKFGWATPLGSDKPNRDVAKACTAALAG